MSKTFARNVSWYIIENVDFSGTRHRSEPIQVVFQGERMERYALPLEPALLQNYPNPFNPETWFPYELAEASEVVLRVFDAQGRLVRQFDLGRRSAGSYLEKQGAVHWDGRDESGQRVASGVYYYTLRASDFTATR